MSYSFLSLKPRTPFEKVLVGIYRVRIGVTAFLQTPSGGQPVGTDRPLSSPIEIDLTGDDDDDDK